jgi:hypothetical protein
MSKVLAACLMLAAQSYSIPPAVLVGIYNVEGGKVGQQVLNTNGTYDLGPMQINTLWMPELAEYWGVSEATAKRWVRDDACTNMGVSAWILRQHLNETGSLGKAIAHYHSRTPDRGAGYRRKVVDAMAKHGLLRPNVPTTPRPQMVVSATRSDQIGKSAERVGGEPKPTTGLATSRGLRPNETRYAARGSNSIVVHNPVNRDVE